MSNSLGLTVPQYAAPAEWNYAAIEPNLAGYAGLSVPRTGLYVTDQALLDALVGYSNTAVHPLVFLTVPPMGFSDERVQNPNAYYPTPALIAQQMSQAITSGANAATSASEAATSASDAASSASAAASSATSAAANAHAREFRLEDQGAVGDGTTDDLAAINATLALMTTGDRLRLTEGKNFAHSGVINLTTSGISIVGGTLTALDSAHCAMYLTGNDIRVIGVTKIVNQTTRTNTTDSHSFVIKGTGNVLDHVVANGAGGVGIFALGATDYLVDSPKVLNTGADGIHNTYGSTRGRIRNPLVYLTGDDAIAVVSYQGDPATTSDIHITNPICYCTGQTNGRGITVVGGEDITVDDYKVIDSAGASVYVNLETAYPIRDIKRIRFNRGEVIRPNTLWGTTNHGAVLIGNSDATHTVDDVVVNDLLVRDAGTTMGTGAGRVITLENTSTGTFTNVSVDDLRVRGVLCGNLTSNTSGLTDAITGVDYGRLTTAARPSAASAISGARYWDTTLGAAGFCTGSTWITPGTTIDPGFTKLAADQALTSNTTATPLTGMNPAVEANATYAIRGFIKYDAGTTGDLTLSFTIPAGATLEWGGTGLGSSASALVGSFASGEASGGGATLTFGGVAAGSHQYVMLTGVLVTGANAGNLQLNFRQAVSDATATTVRANSWLRAERVA